MAKASPFDGVAFELVVYRDGERRTITLYDTKDPAQLEVAQRQTFQHKVAEFVQACLLGRDILVHTYDEFATLAACSLPIGGSGGGGGGGGGGAMAAGTSPLNGFNFSRSEDKDEAVAIREGVDIAGQEVLLTACDPKLKETLEAHDNAIASAMAGADDQYSILAVAEISKRKRELEKREQELADAELAERLEAENIQLETDEAFARSLAEGE